MSLHQKRMAFETQPSNASPPPCAYVTAPTSPNTEFYYSAPVSPRRKPANPIATDDFEFETSKKFSGQLHFDYDRDPLPSMASADELFFNGLVMPLKLPPRLQHDSKSSASSPRSTIRKIPLTLARKSSWNDDFDPFMAALQKVREEEKRGRNSLRSRSYSPFRAVARCSSDCTLYVNEDFSEENTPVERTQVNGPSFSGPLLDFKGSAYASPRRLLLRERVRPLRNDQDGLDNKGRPDENKYGNGVQKLKGLYYALFGRGSKQTKTRSAY